MADTKTTALTEMTAPLATDILYIVDDPGGSAASQKITLENLMKLGGRILISEQTPTGTGTVTWSSIPATYKSLEIECMMRSTEAAEFSSAQIYFNNDTTAANYRKQSDGGYGTTEDAFAADSAQLWSGTITADTSTAGFCTSTIIKINDYAGTTYHKWALSTFVCRRTTIGGFVGVSAVSRENTEAINRVDIVLDSGNWKAGSVFRLYGCY